MNWFKKFFGKFFSIFRDGLENFLVQNMEKAITIAKETVINGGYTTTHEFAQLLWTKLRAEYPNTAGTWLNILANLAVDVLKKNKVL
jgi:hypothetical protein